MNPLAWALLALTGVFAVLDWIAVAGERKTLEYVAKPATTIGLVAVALALDPVHSDMRVWFVIALVVSLAGDVFLMLPRNAFVAGLASFLLAHVAYIVGLNLHSEGLWWLGVLVVPVTLVLGTRLVRGIRRGSHKEMVGPVIAYVTVITVMGASALASGNAMAAAGAVLFMGSDALIGERNFVHPQDWMGVAIMITYHLGQAGLVLSLTT